MLKKHDRVTGYSEGPEVSGCGQKNVTRGPDSDVGSLPQGVDENDDLDFECVVGRGFAHSVGVK